MSPDQARYHRTGETSCAGCNVGVLPVEVTGRDGSRIVSDLLDAGKAPTELQLLRTVAFGLGVRWGHDDLGWWALVRGHDFPSWAVWRQDDSGGVFLVAANLLEAQARSIVSEFESKGHKQTYWC